MSSIHTSELHEARAALRDAGKSAGRYAGYIAVTALSVMFSVVVLITVTQQAVVWAHKAALADGAMTTTTLRPHLQRMEKAATTMPAYGAGLDARLADQNQRNG